jgi:hypothetical protein
MATVANTVLVQLTKWVKGYWLHYSTEPEIRRSASRKAKSCNPVSR